MKVDSIAIVDALEFRHPDVANNGVRHCIRMCTMESSLAVVAMKGAVYWLVPRCWTWCEAADAIQFHLRCWRQGDPPLSGSPDGWTVRVYNKDCIGVLAREAHGVMSSGTVLREG